jgi:succinate dehydrogenase flavin-adding protein (antitoxin of CptAB toxin-antitoxin module)
MRELDELLVGYLEDCYPADDDTDKAAFREVLALADPELNAYLLQRQSPPPESLARVIERIRCRAKA